DAPGSDQRGTSASPAQVLSPSAFRDHRGTSRSGDVRPGSPAAITFGRTADMGTSPRQRRAHRHLAILLSAIEGIVFVGWSRLRPAPPPETRSAVDTEADHNPAQVILFADSGGVLGWGQRCRGLFWLEEHPRLMVCDDMAENDRLLWRSEEILYVL